MKEKIDIKKELLCACEDALDWFEQAYGFGGHDEDDPDLHEVVEHLHAAIDLARAKPTVTRKKAPADVTP